jgi:hypothetical protein
MVDIISYHLNKIIASHQLYLRGKDVEEYKVEAIICRHLGLPEPKL